MSQQNDTEPANRRELELRCHGEKLLLATFEARYSHELAAEEDVFRTLPFFATALGVVVAACAYASTRLPPTPDLLRSYPGAIAFAFLVLVVFCAIAVLIFLLRAARHDRYYRPGTERELVDALDAQVTLFAVDPDTDAEKAADGLRKATITAYLKVIPYNRTINQERRRLRANAASCLVLSLLFALGATGTIFLADKFGSLPRIAP